MFCHGNELAHAGIPENVFQAARNVTGVLNWFTANIGYHHIHHLCARIRNYGLSACHNEHRHLFSDVNRLGLVSTPLLQRRSDFIH